MGRRALAIFIMLVAFAPWSAPAGEGTIAGAGFVSGAPQRVRAPGVHSAQGDTVFLVLQRFDDAGGHGLAVKGDEVEILRWGSGALVALDLNVSDGPSGTFGVEASLPPESFPPDPALLGGSYAFTVPHPSGEDVRIDLVVTPTGAPTFELEEFGPDAGPGGGGLDLIVTWTRSAVADVEISFGDARVVVKGAPVEFSREQWFFGGAGAP